MVRREVETGGRRRKSRGALTSRPEVERLLDAARAPASPRELAGEHAAVDLFARAHLVTSELEVAVATRAPRTGYKAAAAAVAAVIAMSSGVSFAATGHVPFADTLQKVTGHHGGDQESAGGAGRSDGTTTTATASTDANGPRTAALPGLCRAFRHGQKATHGHALEHRPFTALVAAAGGAEQVDDFCAALPPQGQPDTQTEPGHPTHPAHPTHPTTGPSSDPSDPGDTAGTHPAHPTKPTQANTPTKPTHPPKPTQANEPSQKPSKKPHPSAAG